MADEKKRGEISSGGAGWMEMENKAKITASMRKGGSGIRPAIPKVEYFNITDIIFIIATPIHPGTTGPTSASTSTNCYLKKNASATDKNDVSGSMVRTYRMIAQRHTHNDLVPRYPTLRGND